MFVEDAYRSAYTRFQVKVVLVPIDTNEDGSSCGETARQPMRHATAFRHDLFERGVQDFGGKSLLIPDIVGLFPIPFYALDVDELSWEYPLRQTVSLDLIMEREFVSIVTVSRDHEQSQIVEAEVILICLAHNRI